jgi:hypothetical protein
VTALLVPGASLCLPVLATVHGLFSGSDSRQDVIWWVYVVVALVVLFLFVYRTSSIGSDPSRPSRAGL